MVADDQMSPNAQALVHGALRRSIESGKLNPAKQFGRVRQLPRYTEGGLYLGRRPSIPIAIPRVNRVVGKIAKGFFRLKSGYPLPLNYRVGVWVGNSFWRERQSLIDQMTEFSGLGDADFRASFLQDSADPNHTYHLYVFYGSIGFLAETLALKDFGMEPSTVGHDDTLALKLS